jgi:hypothetical protein
MEIKKSSGILESKKSPEEISSIPISRTWTVLDDKGKLDIKKLEYALMTIRKDLEFLESEIEKIREE